MAGLPPWNGEPEAAEHRTTAVGAQNHEEDGEEKGDEDEEGEEGLLGEVHENVANLLYLLILLHLAGVILETRRSGKQVLVAMAPLGR